MENKIARAFRENKKFVILFLVLWIVLEIVLIAPIAVTVAESKNMDQFIANITNFWKSNTMVHNNIYTMFLNRCI